MKGRREGVKKKQLTFPVTASAVSDAGSDTFGHFQPESYLPS